MRLTSSLEAASSPVRDWVWSRPSVTEYHAEGVSPAAPPSLCLPCPKCCPFLPKEGLCNWPHLAIRQCALAHCRKIIEAHGGNNPGLERTRIKGPRCTFRCEGLIQKDSPAGSRIPTPPRIAALRQAHKVRFHAGPSFALPPCDGQHSAM